MPQTRELDGEAILEMSHYAALHLAESYESADRRTLIGGDAGTRLRHMDDAAGEVDAVRHEQAPDRVTWDDTAVTAVFRQPEDVTVGEPGELSRELVAFARRRRNAHGEAVLKDARDVAFEAAKMIDVARPVCRRLVRSAPCHPETY